MTMRPIIAFFVHGLCLLMVCCSLSYAEEMDVRYLHVMLGQLDAEESWIIQPAEDEFSADIDDMIYGGVAVHIGRGEGAFEYGFESGGLASYTSERSSFTRFDEDGLKRYVEVDSSLWIMDMSLGGFVSYRPADWFRIYASAGPAIVIGSLSVEGDEEDDVEADDQTTVVLKGNGNTITFGSGDRETDVDVGVYARVGVDFILANGFMMGVSARRVQTELDFKQGGVLDLDDTQFFISLGKAY